jgi:VIT1/CCC1 family predicted Fe2+/Mn2+ transporter
VFIADAIAPGVVPHPIVWSVLMASMAFFATGVAKARVVQVSWLRSGLQTLGLGGGAALLAYVVGVLLRGIAGVV